MIKKNSLFKCKKSYILSLSATQLLTCGDQEEEHDNSAVEEVLNSFKLKETMTIKIVGNKYQERIKKMFKRFFLYLQLLYAEASMECSSSDMVNLVKIHVQDS